MYGNHEYALSLGGSLIVPEWQVRTPYLRAFGILLRERVQETRQKTAIVTGGGGPSRVYQQALKDLGVTDSDKLDTIGIHPTHTNAMLMRYALEQAGVATQYLPSYEVPVDATRDAWVTGGHHPGQTTDAVMVDWATTLGIQTVINATNKPFVYEMTPDGKINAARPIQEMSWHDYDAMFGASTHTPGESVPFGITAYRKAWELGITAIVLDGNNLMNMKRVFEGKTYDGTVIHP